ncbi:divisome protein SepX/GlpR [Streptomyces apocyni]|uniref:divisome protein SepX/GlpR n=1 Tax=Streptomyces apocyni TaxID=2654677 RepID=UPI0012EA62F1|nr:gephyrin-like molybdotransferase receptor GlpR [Streptomyces apocyni]
MSSSGLIYAVIVGAWAAYLVPMWLRRQDELNEARPTERFSTAIRLLSGRAGMERRYAKDLRQRTEEDEPGTGPDAGTEPVTGSRAIDVRSSAMPSAPAVPSDAEHPDSAPARRARQGAGTGAGGSGGAGVAGQEAAARARRSKVLARRRRTTVALFFAFSVGAIVAAVGGLGFLWAPAAPAALLSAYIVYLRSQERRRFTYTMDRRRAEFAAQRLRERRTGTRRPATPAADPDDHPEPAPEPGLSALAADRRALVEQTDHAEWVDQQRERERGTARGESWDPVPVPLPTYVTAPVAPRATTSVDLGAPDTWSSARSSAAEPAATDRAPHAPPPADDTPTPDATPDAQAPARRAAAGRRSRERGRTPLFDQYADGDRPRAANE